MEKRILRLEDDLWRIRTDTGELADAERNALRAYLDEKGFKTAIIDDNLAIAGKLTWQDVVEPIEGFYEGKADVLSILSGGTTVGLHFNRGRGPFTALNSWKNPRARRGVGEHLPAFVSGFPPSSASQESGLGWDSILLGSLPLEKSARLGVKGRSERSLLPEPLQKWKSRPPDPRWYDPFLPDVRPDMPAPRQ